MASLSMRHVELRFSRSRSLAPLSFSGGGCDANWRGPLYRRHAPKLLELRIVVAVHVRGVAIRSRCAGHPVQPTRGDGGSNPCNGVSTTPDAARGWTPRQYGLPPDPACVRGFFGEPASTLTAS